jgi:hypothetical protein
MRYRSLSVLTVLRGVGAVVNEQNIGVDLVRRRFLCASNDFRFFVCSVTQLIGGPGGLVRPTPE